MLGDPANFIDPDGRAGIPFLQDFMKSDGGTFLFNLAGQATFLGAMLSPLGSIGGTLSNIVSIGASLYSAGSSVKNLAEFSTKGAEKTYGANDIGPDVYCSNSNELHLSDSRANQNQGTNSPADNGLPTIYLVNALSKTLIDLNSVITNLQSLLKLNKMANEYNIKVISIEEMRNMNKNKEFKTCDAIHTIQDGLELFDIDRGSTRLNPWDLSPDASSCYTNVAKCKELQELMKSKNISRSIEFVVAMVTLHEVTHQYVLRMSSYMRPGLNEHQPLWLDSGGHMDAFPNLMCSGLKWNDYLANGADFDDLCMMDVRCRRYFRAFAFCASNGAKIGDDQAWLWGYIDYILHNAKK
jgi:hypothetical protein